MNIAYLKPSDPRWGDFLEQVPHDFYHLPEYSTFSEKYDRGVSEAMLATQGSQYFFLPYQLRSLRDIVWLKNRGDDLSDLLSAYGYPGPLYSGDEWFLRRAVDAWREEMQRRNVVSGFIRLHPLFPVSPVFATGGELKTRGQTVSIDLTLSQEQLWQQMRENHRRDIVKRRRQGVTTEIEDSREAYEFFLRAYHDTMDRRNASKYYYFPLEYFIELKAAMGSRLSLFIARDAAGKPLGGGLFVECQGIVQYHLGGASNEAMNLRPSKLIFDYVINWAKARGNRTLHLGGGLGASSDSLYEFKAGFSPLRHPYCTWHLCFAPPTYAQLELQRRDLPADPPGKDYFPIYRG